MNRQMLCVFFLIFMSLSLLIPATAKANATFFEALIKSSAKITDGVPVRKADELIDTIRRTRVANRWVDDDLAKTGLKLDGLSDTARAAARSDTLLKLLKSSTSLAGDPAMLRKINQLDNAGREAALVLVRGGESLTHVVPDIALRGQLLRRGGPDIITAIGLHGTDVAREAVRFDAALRAGKFKIPSGLPDISLEDFGKVLTRGGETTWGFWKTYIQPHWKLWLAGGGIAWFVVHPESFIDTAGTITEEGVRRLSELGIVIAERSIVATAEATAQTVERVGVATEQGFIRLVEALYHTVFNSPYSFVLWLVGIATALAVSFRRVRYYVLKPFQWLQEIPQKKEWD